MRRGEQSKGTETYDHQWCCSYEEERDSGESVDPFGQDIMSVSFLFAHCISIFELVEGSGLIKVLVLIL